MASSDAYQRLQTAMKAEIQRNTGRVREIESGLGRSEGYLSRLCRGQFSIPLETFLRTLELLGKDPGQFFGKALGVRNDAGSYLGDLIEDAQDPQVERLQRTAAELRLAAADSLRPLPFFPVLVDDAQTRKAQAQLDELMACSGIEQRRRLRTAARYRRVALVTCLLRRLDDQRYDHPREALKMIELVGTEVVPELVDASPTQKFALCLYALGIYGSACRNCEDLANASAALLFALEHAMAAHFEALGAELLRRAACVLLVNQQLPEALDLLGEAMVAFDELDLEVEVGKVQVLRGMIFFNMGNTMSAVKVLNKALRRLPGDQPDLSIYRSSAYQLMALACEASGDLEQSEEWLRHAVKTMDRQSTEQLARLLWHHGWLAQEKGELARAEGPLRQSRELLRARGGIDYALVSLDLTRLLLASGQAREAVAIAEEMSSALRSARKSLRLQQALLSFVRTAIEGRLTLAMVERFERELTQLGARRPGALVRT